MFLVLINLTHEADRDLTIGKRRTALNQIEYWP